MILIDNYDSFTYNIVEYIKELGIDIQVFKNDEISINDIQKIDFSHLIISPGPGNPQFSSCGICEEVIKKFYTTKKILGICLGHQLIARCFGAKIIKDKEPFHGKTSQIVVTKETNLFKNIPEAFNATRYHSLIIDPESLTQEILPIAKTCDKEREIIMSIKIKNYDVYGVQFHPEAILSEYGHELLKNFSQL